MPRQIDNFALSSDRYAPGYVAGYIRGLAGKHTSAGRFKYFQAWDWFCWYCVTPPITPYWTRPKQSLDPQNNEVKREQSCIVCGQVHNTSDDCGREPPERSGRDSMPRRDDGYKLIQARNIGALEED